jgi:hypothetical protein
VAENDKSTVVVKDTPKPAAEEPSPKPESSDESVKVVAVEEDVRVAHPVLTSPAAEGVELEDGRLAVSSSGASVPPAVAEALVNDVTSVKVAD